MITIDHKGVVRAGDAVFGEYGGELNDGVVPRVKIEELVLLLIRWARLSEPQPPLTSPQSPAQSQTGIPLAEDKSALG